MINQLPQENNHRISLETAVAMTTTYRTQKDRILADAFKGNDILPLSETFDRAAFDRLLAQPACTAVRLYYGMNTALQLRIIVVGVDEKDNDILPTVDNPDGGEILDVSKICPPICPVQSPLNI